MTWHTDEERRAARLAALRKYNSKKWYCDSCDKWVVITHKLPHLKTIRHTKPADQLKDLTEQYNCTVEKLKNVTEQYNCTAEQLKNLTEQYNHLVKKTSETNT